MAGINGIGGIPEPIPVRPSNVRDRKGDIQSASSTRDDVAISDAAQEAAGVARYAQAGAASPDVRAERVAAARESLERGDYKREDIVEEVARRISKYLG
ncbi:MAG: flagellar biosynthesis anti-sigma factor FlgM [Candidatus Hydrogenedentes bacterium]|nr:flagellar biosynthesis anti-sigma factor FlgM [Candidatus Hydrogenedentota bacterium]